MIGTRSATKLSIVDHTLRQLNRSRREESAAGRWLQRGGAVDLGAADESARSVSAIVATERPVPFYDRRSGRIMDEVLLMRGGQFPEWAPLLESHAAYSLISVLGSVIQPTASGRVARARLQFADDDYTDQIWRKVRAGHLRAVSVGGIRRKWVDVEPKESATVAGRRWTAGSARPLRITTEWTLREASMVVFGADIDATLG